MTTTRDSDEHLLRADRTYKLHVPAPVPVAQFWGLTLYSENTRRPYENRGTEARSINLDSRDKTLQCNADGSVDLYVGPTVPAAMESNWMRTVDQDGWFVYFRLYAPTEPFFDRSWALPDFEVIALGESLPPDGTWAAHGSRTLPLRAERGTLQGRGPGDDAGSGGRRSRIRMAAAPGPVAWIGPALVSANFSFRSSTERGSDACFATLASVRGSRSRLVVRDQLGNSYRDPEMRCLPRRQRGRHGASAS